jgi:hypothetical protein
METITLTRLYDVLVQKIGRNEAESLTQFIEIKVKDELCTKIEILSTREDIHALRNEMKDNIISMQKWMLGTFITLVVMILGLYATILLKH